MHDKEFSTSGVTRRRFLAGTTLAALSLSSRWQVVAAEPGRKIKLGVIGNGGRGAWIAGLFRKHGGYEMHAVADYFQEVAEQCGDVLGVDQARRFATLSGYKRVLESGVEAVALETPPCFFPQHARAAVDAGLHVYMAKPVAADVPGVLQLEAAAKDAARKNLVFHVDYQMPTDPANQEVLKRIRSEGFGKIAQVATVGITSPFPDPPLTANIESRLRSLIWVNDVVIGGDYIGNYDIHAIDAAVWALGQRPIAAMGGSAVCRSEPHGDARDVCSVVYEYASGIVHNHFGQGLANQPTGELSCRVHGQKGNALINYWGKATFKSNDEAYSEEVQNLYEAGAARNIAAFYEKLTRGDCTNETVPRAVDGALTCFLGREAAARRTRVTMEQLLKEKKKLEVNLRGLKT